MNTFLLFLIPFLGFAGYNAKIALQKRKNQYKYRKKKMIIENNGIFFFPQIDYHESKLILKKSNLNIKNTDILFDSESTIDVFIEEVIHSNDIKEENLLNSIKETILKELIPKINIKVKKFSKKEDKFFENSSNIIEFPEIRNNKFIKVENYMKESTSNNSLNLNLLNSNVSLSPKFIRSKTSSLSKDYLLELNKKEKKKNYSPLNFIKDNIKLEKSPIILFDWSMQELKKKKFEISDPMKFRW